MSRAEGAGEGGLGGALPVTDRSSSLQLKERENKSGGQEKGGGVNIGGQAKSTGRNDYIHSGLYTTFTLTSLQSGTQLFKSIKMENPGEKLAEKKGSPEVQTQQLPQQRHQQQSSSPSVIRYGTITVSRPSAVEKPKLPPLASPTQSVVHSPPGLSLMTGDVEMGGNQLPLPQMTGAFEENLATTNSPIQVFNLTELNSRSPSPNTLQDSQELVIDTDIESISSQPSELQLQVS